MLTPERTIFHRFLQLPTEVRLAIWRECLPRRMSELDVPPADLVYTDLTDTGPARTPCNLWQTTYSNARPPIISQVCRESRAIVFETASACEFSEEIPLDARCVSGTIALNAWLDRVRDSVHLNWAPSYSAQYNSSGSPLQCLAWVAAQLPHGGSLTVDYFIGMYPSRGQIPPAGGVSLAPNHNRTSEASQAMDVLRQLPSWTVVMGVVVVHADFRTAAATGLFGLLGDARVQVIDVSNEAKVNALFDLAEESERKYQVTVGQDFHRDSAESMKQRLTDVIVTTFGSEKIVPPMHPAIMFRLCTEMCNHLGKTTPIQGRGEAGRGRGQRSGRGRGLTRGGARGAT